MTTTSPDGEATPADPGAIDLDVLKTRYDEARQECKKDPWCPWAGEDLVDLMVTEFPALIAEVEALRARWAARVGALTRMSDEVSELETEVEALRARNTTLLRKNGERAKWASDANDRADAAEAQLDDVKLLDQAACKRAVTAEMRVAELETALDDPALPASWHDRAEAAEAREAALAGALGFYRDEWEGHPGDSGPGGNVPQDPCGCGGPV